MSYSLALDWQADSLRFINSPMGERLCRSQMKTSETDYARAGLGLPPMDYRKYGQCLSDSLEYGEPYYWAPELCELLGETSAEMPDWTFKADLLPSTEGCFYFARPIPLDAWRDEGTNDLAAISWCRIRRATDEAITGVLLAFWTRMDLRPAGVPVTMFAWDYGTALSEVLGIALEAVPVKNTERFIGKARVFAAACAFIQQRILVTHPERPERHTRKRAAGLWEHEPIIRVVQLRRAVTDGRPGDRGGEPIEWSCQWVVRGFWRQQACGPNLSERRPVFVLPYIKGPADKPLKAPADRVFAVVR